MLTNPSQDCEKGDFMGKKMTAEDASLITALQNKMNKIFEEQESLYKQMFEKYGESEHYLEHRDQEHPWIKIVLSDNLKKLKEKGVLWKSTKVSPITIETKPLKKKPNKME